jgi:hypothetical protein
VIFFFFFIICCFNDFLRLYRQCFNLLVVFDKCLEVRENVFKLLLIYKIIEDMHASLAADLAIPKQA